jgi:SAM-dependent methyltransferase
VPDADPASTFAGPNAYSDRWFATFQTDLDPTLAVRDIAFLERQLPRQSFGRLLDLCCGTGRHALPLAQRGYAVVGLDRMARALDVLGTTGVRPVDRVQADMRALPIRDGSVDAVICMWQSFGQFAPHVNRAVLADVQRVVRPGGRLVLDVYDRAFHERLPGHRVLQRGRQTIVEERRFQGRRLFVRLIYGPVDPSSSDEFEWELYVPDELASEGAAVGLRLRLACADFDDDRPPTGDAPRMQLIFERPQ